MKRERLFVMSSPFRDEFRIHGFRFGSGRKSLAVVGAMRGDELQQQFVCSRLVHTLQDLEERGELMPGHEILIIPSANPFAMNIGKRFWAMDNTDINRMFPGYPLGETTQRIAAALFEHIQGYRFGVQLASYYLPGDFIPHVRMMHTGYEDVELAQGFGLPYTLVRNPLPIDTTTLNYNWQIWETQAFSVYAGHTGVIDASSADDSLSALSGTAPIRAITPKWCRRTNSSTSKPVGRASCTACAGPTTLCAVISASPVFSIRTTVPCAGRCALPRTAPSSSCRPVRWCWKIPCFSGSFRAEHASRKAVLPKRKGPLLGAALRVRQA